MLEIALNPKTHEFIYQGNYSIHMSGCNASIQCSLTKSVILVSYANLRKYRNFLELNCLCLIFSKTVWPKFPSLKLGLTYNFEHASFPTSILWNKHW